MRSNYIKLFNLQVLHSYFSDAMCQGLQFYPGPASRALFKRFDVKANKFTNGLAVYLNTSQPLELTLDYISKVTGFDCLDYVIQTTDPDFYLYTARTIDNTWQILYDSQSTVTRPGSDFLELTGHYLCDQTEKGIARVVIRFQDLINHDGDNGTNFSISYQARSTQWQYYFISTNGVNLSDAAIQSKNNVDFEGPSAVILENGQSATLFSSGKQLLELSQDTKYKFDLVTKPGSEQKKGSASKIIYKDLPSPAPGQIDRATGDNMQQLASPIYVYI